MAICKNSTFMVILLMGLALGPEIVSGVYCECYYNHGTCRGLPSAQLECFHITSAEMVQCVEERLRNISSSLDPNTIYNIKLSYSDMDLFPDNFLAPYKVWLLDIDYSNMTGFPHRLINPICATLLKLWINYNTGIDRIGANGFAHCPLLYDISITGNSIVEVSPQAFVGADNLKVLEIRYEPLTSISRLQGLETLETFRLDYDNLDTVDKNAFLNMSALTEVHLEHNNLKTLEEGTFDPIDRDRTQVNLEYNPFYCDCSLAWLKNWIEGDPFYDNVTCDGPIKGPLKNMDYLDECESSKLH